MMTKLVLCTLLLGGAYAAYVSVRHRDLEPGLAGSSQAQQISVSEAEKRLKTHMATIETRQKAMDALYLEGNAARTLKTAIDNASARDHQDYSRHDVNYHYLRWTWSRDLQSYYTSHLDALSASLEAIRKKGSVPAEKMAYLDRGMAEWTQMEPTFQKVCSDYASFLAGADVDSVDFAPLDKLLDGQYGTLTKFDAIKFDDTDDTIESAPGAKDGEEP
jgi:hypothetical protein